MSTSGDRFEPHGIAVTAFDGHTEFASLDFTQRLAWISETAVSVYVFARCNPEAGCNAFFEPRPEVGDASE